MQALPIELIYDTSLPTLLCVCISDKMVAVVPLAPLFQTLRHERNIRSDVAVCGPSLYTTATWRAMLCYSSSPAQKNNYYFR